MTAQNVCRVHGGMAPRARHAAYVRQAEADIMRQFRWEYGRWVREWNAWQARRIAITAELLDMPVEEVEPAHIGLARGWFGGPEGLEAEPKMRRDRRFGPRQPWQGGRRPPGVQQSLSATELHNRAEQQRDGMPGLPPTV